MAYHDNSSVPPWSWCTCVILVLIILGVGSVCFYHVHELYTQPFICSNGVHYYKKVSFLHCQPEESRWYLFNIKHQLYAGHIFLPLASWKIGLADEQLRSRIAQFLSAFIVVYPLLQNMVEIEVNKNCINRTVNDEDRYVIQQAVVNTWVFLISNIILCLALLVAAAVKCCPKRQNHDQTASIREGATSRQEERSVSLQTTCLVNIDRKSEHLAYGTIQNIQMDPIVSLPETSESLFATPQEQELPASSLVPVVNDQPVSSETPAMPPGQEIQVTLEEIFAKLEGIEKLLNTKKTRERRLLINYDSLTRSWCGPDDRCCAKAFYVLNRLIFHPYYWVNNIATRFLTISGTIVAMFILYIILIPRSLSSNTIFVPQLFNPIKHDNDFTRKMAFYFIGLLLIAFLGRVCKYFPYKIDEITDNMETLKDFFRNVFDRSNRFVLLTAVTDVASCIRLRNQAV